MSDKQVSSREKANTEKHQFERDNPELAVRLMSDKPEVTAAERVSVESEVLEYHQELVKLCRQLVALHVDAAYFDKITDGRFARETSNERIRYLLEDDIRNLLRKNGDFPR